MPTVAPSSARSRLLLFLSGPCWPVTAGALAGVIYLATLSRCAYPGESAGWIASVAGLIPERHAAHPCWSLISGILAQVPVFSLPVRLNLFSAACASLVVGLFGRLIALLIHQSAREDMSGLDAILLPERDSDANEDDLGAVDPKQLDPAILEHNQRASNVALLGGWMSALALAFSTPFWSAATRFQYQTFDLLLLVAVASVVLRHRRTPTFPLALGVSLLIGIGCVESALFLPMAPVFILLLLANRVRRGVPWERQVGWGLVATGFGACCGLLLLGRLQPATPGMDAVAAIRALLIAVAREHLEALSAILPHVGWTWVLLLAFVPAAISLFTATQAFRIPSLTVLGVYLLFLVSAVCCLLNVPVSPWHLARESGALPVLASLAFAVTSGYVVAFGLLLGRSSEELEEYETTALPAGAARWLGTGLAVTISAIVCFSAFRNRVESDGRRGAFADQAAGSVLAMLGSRDWIVSDGLLDPHLLILANARGIPLHLLPLAKQASAAQIAELNAWIDRDPSVAPNRVRLHNAVSLGIVPFVREWIAVDPAAHRRLMLLGVPEIWTISGCQPVPQGLGFVGVRSLDELRGHDLLDPPRGRNLRLDLLLAPAAGDPPLLDQFRNELRRQAGLAANNLGVLLEDLHRPEDALVAYRKAHRIDPRNLSSIINQLALVTRPSQSRLRDELERDLRARAKEEGRLPPVPFLVRSYGDIRQPGALAIQGMVWAAQGQPALANSEADRARDLMPGRTDMNVRLGSLYLNQGDMIAGERAYRELLAAPVTTNSTCQALLGLATVAFQEGRVKEAGKWLEQARLAGAPESSLLIHEATWLAATGKAEEAIARLRAFTDTHPDQIETWALLADLVLKRDGAADVETRILPAMIKAAGKQDHVLIHLVRAQLLRSKRPVQFEQARTALLHALSIRPDLASVQNELLNLDFASNDRDAMERDASNVLRQSPDHPFANYLLATILLERNELDRAEDRFRRSLAARPTMAASNDLAETLRRAHRFAEAEKMAREAVRLEAKAYPAWDTLGCILLDAGHPDEAARAVEQSLSICKTDPRIHLTLARVRLAQGRTNDAQQVILSAENAFGARLPASIRQEFSVLRQTIKNPDPGSRP